MEASLTRSTWAIAAILLVTLAGGLWTEALGAGRERRDELRETVLSFFDAWHVERNVNAALGQIAPEALASRYLLAENCAGYIDDVDRGNPSKTAAGVLAFLRDFDVPCNSGTPVAMLTPFPADKLLVSKGTVLNSVEEDRFALLRGLHAPADDFEQTSRELRSTYPSMRFFTVLGQLELCNENGTTLAPMYLILAQDRQRTVVVSVGFFCQ